MKAYPTVNFRHYVQPSEPLASGLGILNFNNFTSTYPMQMVGRIDGENAVKQGEGYMFNKMKEWDASKELKQQFPRVGDYLTHETKLQN